METRPKNAAEIAWDRDQLIECLDEAIVPLAALVEEWRNYEGDCFLSTMLRCIRVIDQIECAHLMVKRDRVGDKYDPTTCSRTRYDNMPLKYTTDARSVLDRGDAVDEAMVRDDRGADIAHCGACGHDVMIEWGQDLRKRCAACGCADLGTAPS